MVIGADGANSRVAKEIDAGEYDYAIAFQERIRIPDDKMEYYKDLAEMYVGDDVSPDFYGWVFPKYDHVAVGTGTVVNKTAIKKYQQATRDRSKVRLHPPVSLLSLTYILVKSPVLLRLLGFKRFVLYPQCSFGLAVPVHSYPSATFTTFSARSQAAFAAATIVTPCFSCSRHDISLQM